MTRQKFPRVGVGVLVIQDNKLLLAKRKNAHGVGTWSPPGGHLEFGETVEHCAARELFEETGLIADSIETLSWVNTIFEQEQKHYITIFTLVTQFSGSPEIKEPDKAEFWKWFDINQLPEPLFAPVATFFEQKKINNLQAYK
ncbi:MAG: NUDIX hydrolase [Candidatus Babeliaceae bacterium]|jgi:8-oxo-dGTP diphosphatase